MRMWLDVSNIEVATYIRRFLNHRVFRSQRQRSGVVARVHRGGVEYWLRQQTTPASTTWE